MAKQSPQRKAQVASYFVMTRKGTFRPAQHTTNQCKEPGWPEYAYELRMVFRGDMQLDRDGFIVDHADIHEMVVNLGLAGSCEQFSTRILTALDSFMSNSGIPMLACRCIVRAIDPNAPAWLERLHIYREAPPEAVKLL